MDLVKEICGALDAAANYFRANPYDGTGWTAEAHGRIGDLATRFATSQGIACGMPTGSSVGGKRLMVHIAGRTRPAIDGQFLFDQCWLTAYDNKDAPATDGYTTRCNLAMETEWLTNSEEINRDFLKLVVSKADMKIMVCVANDEASCHKIVTELTQQATLFERNSEGNETYIFSVFCYHDRKFHHFMKIGAVASVTEFP